MESHFCRFGIHAFSAGGIIRRWKRDLLVYVREHLLHLVKAVQARRAACQRQLIAAENFADIVTFRLAVDTEPNGRTILCHAIAAAETMLVVDISIDGAGQIENVVARDMAEFTGKARRVIAVAVIRVGALDTPAQRLGMTADDIGEQRVALHIVSRAAADQLDAFHTSRRNALQHVFKCIFLARRTLAIDENIAAGTGIAAQFAVAFLKTETRHQLHDVERGHGLRAGEIAGFERCNAAACVSRNRRCGVR